MRIYFVSTPEGTQRLIRAKSRQDAVWFVAQGKYIAKPASQDALIELTTKGVVVESVKPAEQTELDL